MRASNLEMSLAGPADDAALRRLLRDTPMPGTVALSFECEPSFASAAEVEGPLHQTVVAREAESGEVAGMACRSIADRYVNGQPRPVGYLSHLRASPRYGWGAAAARVLGRGFSFMRQLHADGRATFYLISVVDGNPRAARLLTSGLHGYPTLRSIGRLTTSALLVRRRRAPAAPVGVTISRAGPEHLEQIEICLSRGGMRHHLAPVWTAADLSSGSRTPGLALSDFHVALRDGAVVGCLAGWDQRHFRQAVVRGYGPPLDRWRRPLNWGASLLGYKRLPNVGARLEQTYASHIAIDGDDGDVFAALLGAVHDDAAARGTGLVSLALPEGHPLCEVLRRYRHFSYPSELYVAAWDEDELPALDNRPVWPEIAAL